MDKPVPKREFLLRMPEPLVERVEKFAARAGMTRTGAVNYLCLLAIDRVDQGDDAPTRNERRAR